MDYGVSYRGDEARAAEVAARAGQLVELTKALMTSAGLSRLTKTYDLPTGEVVHVVIQDFSAHVYIDAAPTKKGSKAELPDKKTKLVKKELPFFGINLAYTLKTQYKDICTTYSTCTSYPLWDKYYQLKYLCFAKQKPDEKLLPYYYEPDVKIPNVDVYNDGDDKSRFNAEAYEALKYPPGPLSETVAGVGYVKNGIPEGKHFMDAASNLHTNYEETYGWTWLGGTPEAPDMLKFYGSPNRLTAPLWDAGTQMGFYDEVFNKPINKPETSTFVYQSGMRPAYGRYVLGGGRITVWRWYSSIALMWSVSSDKNVAVEAVRGIKDAGGQAAIEEVQHYVVGSVDPASAYGYRYSVTSEGVESWELEQQQNMYTALELHSLQCENQDAEWVFITRIEAGLSGPQNYQDRYQGAIFSSDGLQMKMVHRYDSFDSPFYDARTILVSAEFAPNIDAASGEISFVATSDVWDSENWWESEGRTTTEEFSQTPIDINDVNASVFTRIDPYHEPTPVHGYSTAWELNPFFGMLPGVDIPAKILRCIGPTSAINPDVYNLAPQIFKNISTEALTYSGGYTGLTCTKTSGWWSCPSGTTPYTGGGLYTNQDGTQVYAKNQSYILSAKGWTKYTYTSPAVSWSPQLYDYYSDYTPSPTTETITYDWHSAYSVQGNDKWYPKTDVKWPIHVDYKPGVGFVYILLDFYYDDESHANYTYDFHQSFEATTVVHEGVSKRWFVSWPTTDCQGESSVQRIYILSPSAWSFDAITEYKLSVYGSGVSYQVLTPAQAASWQPPETGQTVTCNQFDPPRTFTYVVSYDGSRPFKVSVAGVYPKSRSVSADNGTFLKKAWLKNDLDICGETVNVLTEEYHDYGPTTFFSVEPYDQTLGSLNRSATFTDPYYAYNSYRVYNPSGYGIVKTLYYRGAYTHPTNNFYSRHPAPKYIKNTSLRFVDLRYDAYVMASFNYTTSYGPWSGNNFQFSNPVVVDVKVNLHVNGEDIELYTYEPANVHTNYYDTGDVQFFKYRSPAEDVIAAFTGADQYVLSFALPLPQETSSSININFGAIRYKAYDASDASVTLFSGLGSGISNERINPITDKIVLATLGIGWLTRYVEETE